MLAPDLRGFGDSSAPAEASAYDVLTLCVDMCGLLDAVGEQSANFSGHDWGRPWSGSSPLDLSGA